MLAAMPSPIFTFSSPYTPAVSSPLSSSPIRASQSSPPLSPRDPNTQIRRDARSSPIQAFKFQTSPVPPTKSKFAARNTKPNPLKQSRDNAQESRRKLFLKNVRQRHEDKQWERRGGDQEALKLEWSTSDRRWREQKDTDLDGILFEEDLEDIPVKLQKQQSSQDSDEMMVDEVAQAEEAEMNAMLSMYEAQSSRTRASWRSDSPSLSDDDDYDSLFIDFLSQQDHSQDIAMSGEMDLS